MVRRRILARIDCGISTPTPARAVIYLDVETSADVGNDHLDYIAAWVPGITADGRDTPGIYCFARPTVAQIADRIGAAYPFWVCRFPSITDITIDVASESPPDPSKAGTPPRS